MRIGIAVGVIVFLNAAGWAPPARALPADHTAQEQAMYDELMKMSGPEDAAKAALAKKYGKTTAQVTEILNRVQRDMYAPAPKKTAPAATKSTARPSEGVALAAVGALLGGNKLGVTGSDLSTMPNPKGAGLFVYAPKTRFGGVERKLVWLVFDSAQVYALNGAAKDVTPRAAWPREAPPAVWAKSGLNPTSPAEALAVVFGN